MAFMKPQVYETDYLEIDGPMGGEIIPCDVADLNQDPDPTADYDENWIGFWKEFDGEIETPSNIRDYCENRKLYSIERKHGFVGRMSAPGYMDCTSWIAGSTAEEVSAELARMFGDDE